MMVAYRLPNRGFAAEHACLRHGKKCLANLLCSHATRQCSTSPRSLTPTNSQACSASTLACMSVWRFRSYAQSPVSSEAVRALLSGSFSTLANPSRQRSISPQTTLAHQKQASSFLKAAACTSRTQPRIASSNHHAPLRMQLYTARAFVAPLPAGLKYVCVSSLYVHTFCIGVCLCKYTRLYSY